MSRALFADRSDAGRQLARAVTKVSAGRSPLVLALPRGGVPVALEVARALDAPLDVLVVRKLGMPGYEELAMGAIAGGGAEVINEDVVRSYGVPEAAIQAVREREQAELARRERAYRGDRPPLHLRGRDVVVVDDGVATGATIRAAVAALRQAGVGHITVAVPVAAPDVARQLAREADELVCLALPEPFGAVGRFYDRFDQTTDEEVRRALAESPAGP
ncbi:MAG: phosphoribosyltransferase [Actinomycetales bacterium]|nr:phosphoribosyltransferase [Actinomycetales bacterium]